MSDEYAFPRYPNCLNHEESGMTLRDYFAAKAMQAMITMACPTNTNLMAMDAYIFADAMLEARK